jgi:hypothetical protein
LVEASVKIVFPGGTINIIIVMQRKTAKRSIKKPAENNRVRFKMSLRKLQPQAASGETSNQKE